MPAIPHPKPAQRRAEPWTKQIAKLAASPWALSFTSFALTALVIRSNAGLFF